MGVPHFFRTGLCLCSHACVGVCVHVWSQFHAAAVETQRKLDVLASSCREIKESSKLRGVLETILVIGNVMNEGTHKGGAQGFTLDRSVLHNPPPLCIQ